MRTLKELYTILYDKIKDESCIIGLCNAMYYLKYHEFISNDEYHFLYRHFKSQKELHPEFMQNSSTWYGGVFWWRTKEDNNPINRKGLIKKLMETT